MASLVLTAAGTAIGGPIGGALGAVLGRQVDQNILFKPQGREGPRLQELAVQTSSYGAQIPRLYGKMRVAGTVIWATDLKESSESNGGGKGRPSNTTYSYSACLAVALSSRNIASIGRIWADGKILRGSAGDFKTETGFRFYGGQEDQAADGLMASAEAAGETPAYRGLAVAVFEDMDLTDYGNRIPSLTFELIADNGAVSVGAIIDDIAGNGTAAFVEDQIDGFAATGQDGRDVLGVIGESFSLSFLSAPGGMMAEPRQRQEEVAAVFIYDDIVASRDGELVERPESRILAETKTTRQYSLRYYDPARDYQSGVQNAFRPGQSRVVRHQDFPAAMEATKAKNMAQTKLWLLYQERSTVQLDVLRTGRSMKPGTLVRWDDSDDIWRVRNWELHRGSISLALSKAGFAIPDTERPTDNGRSVKELDGLAGTTRLALVDLPFALDAPAQLSDNPKLYAAAAGDLGWRHAELFVVAADGVASDFIGQIPAPSTMGTTPEPLPPSGAHLIDRRNRLLVQMHNRNMILHHADNAQLSAGHNLAAIGREIIQFGSAEPIGDDRYQLSELLRGLGGTEREMGNHGTDEDFILLKGAGLTEIEARHFVPFHPVTLSAIGRGDDSPIFRSIDNPGRALKPWSPVHPYSVFRDNGDLEIGWTRRSRAGLIWPDHVEIPLAEEAEKYRVRIDNEIVDEPHVPVTLLPAATVQAYRDVSVSSLSIEVQQIGSHNVSDPLLFEVPI